MAGFQNNFEDHRRLAEQLLESQAAIRKPEQASWKRGALEGFSQFLSNFIVACRNFIFNFFTKI
jgi:hypothetical protein